MTYQDIKVQDALETLEPFIKAAQDVLILTSSKENQEKALKVNSSWQLIVNQCEIASNARTLIDAIEIIRDNDIT